MQLLSGPMEGLTGWVWRQAHSRHFLRPDAYFAPFFSPTSAHVYPPKALAEVLPEHNAGITLVPQLLANDPERFLWAAEYLADQGYAEVNLNLGCPSGTVTAKYKGAGLLRCPDEVDALLDGIFARTPVAVSVKTRLGCADAAEFGPLLTIYRRYPLKRLIVHARVREAMYRGVPDLAAFAPALADAPWPVCYNGDIFTRDDLASFSAAFPQAKQVMLGRGLAADPGLIGRIRTGTPTARETFAAFHAELCALYRENSPGGDGPVLNRMKEHWAYWQYLFEDAQRPLKALRKARSWTDLLAAADTILCTCPLREDAESVK